jgi:hypothetical protein
MPYDAWVQQYTVQCLYFNWVYIFSLCFVFASLKVVIEKQVHTVDIISINQSKCIIVTRRHKVSCVGIHIYTHNNIVTWLYILCGDEESYNITYCIVTSFCQWSARLSVTCTCVRLMVATKVDWTCWDLIRQPSVHQSNALPTEPHGLAVDCCCLKAIFITMQIRRHARLACSYGACECMIAKPMNINRIDSHMYHVLHFGVLIWSSFGGVYRMYKHAYKYTCRVTAYC